MLWTIIGLLVLFWVLGLVFKVAGGLIHLLLIAAVVLFVVNFFKNRATR
ncbi:lmo0937 family membrane protein [Neobacillus notoginsengisoli]|uniref:Lmo0937 family membrane protein n=1 Tax=Neobacillus notoginsengisoli TaxID=1578198 RepID=A0A417YXA7_9BACI|nr:lmo0937 family membrane protein [Neobacillus notoginsengisoli]RHW42204.1 lmo0937 family membrane protein [Neobacillus notoginsengisoli]